jgi:hypothetical protein
VGATPTFAFPWPDPTAMIDIPEHIKQLAEAIDLKLSGAFPGMITPYRGSTPPPGWILCDGTGGAPDLRDLFVLGASAAHPLLSAGGANSQVPGTVPHSHAPGAVSTVNTGHTHGNGSVGIGTDGVGDHSHNAGAATLQNGTPGVPRDLLVVGGPPVYYDTNRIGAGNALVTGSGATNNIAHNHGVGGQSVDASGANPPHSHPAFNTSADGGVGAPAALDNRPVFYTLIYIKKV